MTVICDISDWNKCFLILFSDSKYSSYWKHLFTVYPRIIDLSKNEWALLYNGTIQKGGILEVLKDWARIIRVEKKCSVPTDLSESNLKNVKLFVSANAEFSLQYDDTNAISKIQNDYQSK